MTDEHAFGIEAFALDDRLRLFHFAAADKRLEYLWVLRAFDRARANYTVLLHANDVAAQLSELAADHPDAPTLDGDLTPLLDQLYGWQVLERSYDGARAATLAEYRNRHYVYQFSQAGYRAYRAVEDVLGATLDDATLSRLVFPEILHDLQELAEANARGDAEQVYRKLTRLDTTLSDMAARAARFYLMLGDLSRTNDARPEIFLAHKDALLAHMREFSSELARYSPKLADAISAVEATGVDRLIEAAATADERIFASPAERISDWRQRWSGLTHWFRAEEDAPSESERLQAGTVSAISAVLALLRRVTEARRGGVSRESQLRHLAAWFTGVESDAAAHALFACAFNLRTPRHVSTTYPDAELIPTRRSWWEAPPVEISRTLVETGKPASPGSPRPGRPQRRGPQAPAGTSGRRAAGPNRGGASPGRAGPRRPRPRRAGDRTAARPVGPRACRPRAGVRGDQRQRVGLRGPAHAAPASGGDHRQHRPRTAAPRSHRGAGGGSTMKTFPVGLQAMDTDSVMH